MTIKPFFFALTALLLVAGGAAALAPGDALAQAKAGWTDRVSLSPVGGHVLGNPKASRRLVEYASYTCPHCAVFEAQDAPVLQSKYVASGTLSFELRNLIRDPVDMTAAMLARCGGATKFFGNHHAIMAMQGQWLPASQTASKATRESWFQGDYPIRMARVARDTGLYRVIRGRGFADAEIDACLADADAQATITAMSSQGVKLGVNGTPSFLLDGKLLAGVNDWAALKPLLAARASRR